MFSNVYYDQKSKKMYLWEILSDGTKLKDIVSDYKIEYYISDKTNKSSIKDIYGIPVIKREAEDIFKLKTLQDSGVYLCESDISEEIKFLHKRYEKVPNLKPSFEHFNIAYLDIEVAAEDIFPNPEKADFPINLITIKFSKSKETYTFGLQNYTGSKTLKNYSYFAKEIDLLESFISVFRKNKVDIITGWNVHKFDIEYIIRRLMKLNNYDLSCKLSPINLISEEPNGFKIAGISILDYYDLYKNFEKENLESYSLDFVAEHELGIGKIKFDGVINDLYKRDWNKFVEYNIHDVELVETLDNKLKYILLTINFCYESLIPFEKIYSSIAIITGYILKYLHNKNMVMPNKPNKESEDYPGAYVYAKEGFYKNLVNFDVESLYPHNLMFANISPETLITDLDKIEILKSKNMLISTPIDGVYYTKEFQGIIPEIVEKIFNDRKYYKGLAKEAEKKGDKVLYEYYDGLQYIRKILINSFYGVLGNKHFHFYNAINAKAVTILGQHLIKFLSENTNRYFQEYFYKNKKFFKEPLKENPFKNQDICVLIDTDSIYLHLDKIYSIVGSNKNFRDWADDFVKIFLDKFFKELLDIFASKFNNKNIWNFRREKIISKMFILAKKKYALEVLDTEGYLHPKPKIITTGVEVVRTSTPKFCRDKILNVLQTLFNTLDREKLLEELKTIKDEFKKQNISQIAFPRGISDYSKYAKATSTYIRDGLFYPKSCPIHIRAAMNYNYLNTKFGLKLQPIIDGSKIKFIYIDNRNILNENIIGFISEYPEKFKELFKINYDEQWDKSFQSVIQRFFEVLGWGEINLKNQKISKFITF